MKPFFTSPIAFLAFALLHVGQIVVMADELPKDTNEIKSLTVEQARKLAETFPGAEFDGWPKSLPLNGFKKLDSDVAQALAGYSKGPLFLNGLTTLDVDTAKALAEFKGEVLALFGLTTLDADTAKALAAFKGVAMGLDRLTALDAETAKALAEFKGQELHISGLITLDAATAKALAEFKGWLYLNGLTTLDADTAKALAEVKGQCLSLIGVTTLDADTAKALAEFKGQSLLLKGLTTLDADTAKWLAGFEGRVYLHPDVKKSFVEKYPLTPKTALLWATVSAGELGITALDSPDSVAIAQALATRKGPLRLPNLKKISPKTLSALINKDDVEIPLIETLELIQEPDGSVTEDFVIPESFQKGQQKQSK